VKTTQGKGTLRLIGAFKLVKGALLAVIAFKMLRHIHDDLELAGYALALRLHLDPEGRLVEPILRRLLDVDPRTLTHFGVGALAYAALLWTEGVGLILRQHWAEYLTIVATACLVPFELYELSRAMTLTRIVALVVNVVIVAYLVRVLRRDRRLAVVATHAR
jgi:uncharacterized membrane protein (DUF2068 family)